MRQIPLAIIAEIIVIVITLIFGRYEIRKGKEIGSPSIIADGKHVIADMLSSMAVLAGLIGNLFGVTCSLCRYYIHSPCWNSYLYRRYEGLIGRIAGF